MKSDLVLGYYVSSVEFGTTKHENFSYNPKATNSN